MSTAPADPPQQQTVHVVGSYIVGPTIGKGFFAKVKRVEDQDRNVWAMKCFDKERISRSAHSLKQVEKEINALRLCNHPNVARFHEVLEVENTVYLVMEYIPHGELFDYIKSRGRLPEPEAVYLARQVCSALAYCHRVGIAHRDIKPENILIDANNNVKIVDFGLATFYLSGDYGGGESAPLPSPEDVAVEAPPAQAFKQLTTQCGSPHYAAPEVLLGLGYHGPAADIWSLGVLLFAMVTGSLPFTARTIPQLVQKIVSGVFRFAPFMSRNARHLIGSMLRVNPPDRITITEVLAHPWFTETEAWIPPSPGAPLSVSGSDSSGPSTSTSSAALQLVSSVASQLAAARRNAACSSGLCAECGKPMTVRTDAQGMYVLSSCTVSADDASVGGSVSPSGTALGACAGVPVTDTADRCRCAHRIWSAPPSSSSGASTATTAAPDTQNDVDAVSTPGGGVITMAKQFESSPAERLSLDSAFFRLPPPVDMMRATPSIREYEMIRACEEGNLEAVRRLLTEAEPCPGLFAAASGHRSRGASANSTSSASAVAPSPVSSPSKTEKEEKKKEKVPSKLASKFAALAQRVTGHGHTAVPAEPEAEAEAEADEDAEGDGEGSTGDFLAWRLRGTCSCPDQRHRLDLRARAADNWTALHYAARSGHADIAEELLLSCLPLDINAVTKSHWTPLMLAADKGHTAVVELLIRFRADIHAVTADGKTAIFLARERQHTFISQRLTEASSSRHLAALKHNPFVSADASHALSTADGAGADASASPAILSIVHAVQSIRAATAAATGNAAPDVSSVSSTSNDSGAVRRAWFSASPLQADLFSACESGDVARVRKLFELSVQAVDHLHATSPAGTPIPAAEVDFFARGIDNWSAFHYAARRNHHDVIVFIIEALVGASVPAARIISEINALTKSGWTPLMMAVDRGHVETVRLLMKCGADPTIVASDKESARSLLNSYRNQPSYPFAEMKSIIEKV